MRNPYACARLGVGHLYVRNAVLFPSTDANDHAVRHVKERPSDDELRGRPLAFALAIFPFAYTTQWHIGRPLFVSILMEIAHRL